MASSSPLAGRPLTYVPFTSEIELSFYSTLFSSKLEHDKLDDSARQVLGQYEPQPCPPETSCKMRILGSALSSIGGPLGSIRADGIIKNTNTIEDFKNLDKTEMIKSAGKQIWDAIRDGSIYSVPSLLASFRIISFADLKKYKCTYWFAFPALHSSWYHTAEVGRFTAQESSALVEKVGTWRYGVDGREHGFFLAKKVAPTTSDESEDSVTAAELPFVWKVGSLKDFETGFFKEVDENDRYVAFVDPSTYEQNPGWPVRNLLVLIQHRFGMKKANIICYRDAHARRDEARSLVLSVALDETKATPSGEMPKVTGWERNGGALTAKLVNLAEHMSPERLVDNATDLNLKLMKWRIAPDLNLDILKQTRCLLLGAGTLGCHASLILMGWGFREITFVDHGTVKYSNPARQPLFLAEDCLNGGAPKASQAAEALKKRCPGIASRGVKLSIPSLGHPFLDDGSQTKTDFDTLRELIDQHDAIFLLTDTRESRWLPTLMGKAVGKIVLTAALGFDSWVAMRHGAEPRTDDDDAASLGCYFCNDVVSPGNSTKDRTLDQECTVTRPSVAPKASADLVDILASLLQHPKGVHADAPQSSSANFDPPEHPLGLVPHQIRGYMSTWQNVVIRGQAYKNCSACSPVILEAYRKDGWEFVKKALTDKEYVSELSGLAEIQRQAEQVAEDLGWNDDGMDDSDGELL